MTPDEADEEERVRRCDYCRLPIPKETVEAEVAGDTYAFCSGACRDAQAEGDQVFTEYHGHRRFETGVSALDEGLPQGVPRNSFVMLTDLAGTRTEALQAELVWRALQRGEPVVLVSFLEPPVSIIQEFATLEWNVLPYLEEGLLHVLDCFTYRVDDRQRMFDRMNAWNAHLSDVASDATTRVRSPGKLRELSNQLDRAMEANEMHDEGIVVIDSLTELGTHVQAIKAYDFVKDVRADVCKGRFVPVFAGATQTTKEATFPHDLKYIVDGVIEMRLNEEIVDDALIKQLRIRKMSGVLTYPEWKVYEYTAGEGIVTFDPIEEMKEAREERDGDGAETPSPTEERAAVGTEGTDGESETDADAPTAAENADRTAGERAAADAVEGGDDGSGGEGTDDEDTAGADEDGT